MSLLMGQASIIPSFKLSCALDLRLEETHNAMPARPKVAPRAPPMMMDLCEPASGSSFNGASSCKGIML